MAWLLVLDGSEYLHTTISRVYKEWKNIQYEAVLWAKMPCWC